MQWLFLSPVLADVELPGLNSNPAPAVATRISPVFVALAAFALLVVGYLVWDFWHQKRTERKQRQRIEQFRRNKFKGESELGQTNRGS